MPRIIAKNQTASPLILNQLSIPDRTIPASGQVELTLYNTITAIQNDVELMTYINNNSVLLNNGARDLTKVESTNFVTPVATTSDVTMAAPVALGSANAEGVAASLARSDHIHLASLLQSLVAKVAADTTTTSTTFVTLLTVNVTTVASAKLLILAAFSASNSTPGAGMYFRVTVDGVSQGGMAARYSGAPGMSGSLNCGVTDLAAGAHTVLLAWRVDGGTGRIRPVTDAIDIESASLRILEVSK